MKTVVCISVFFVLLSVVLYIVSRNLRYCCYGGKVPGSILLRLAVFIAVPSFSSCITIVFVSVLAVGFFAGLCFFITSWIILMMAGCVLINESDEILDYRGNLGCIYREKQRLRELTRRLEGENEESWGEKNFPQAPTIHLHPFEESPARSRWGLRFDDN